MIEVEGFLVPLSAIRRGFYHETYFTVSADRCSELDFGGSEGIGINSDETIAFLIAAKTIGDKTQSRVRKSTSDLTHSPVIVGRKHRLWGYCSIETDKGQIGKVLIMVCAHHATVGQKTNAPQWIFAINGASNMITHWRKHFR